MATYACSDLHGFYSIYEKMNNFLKDEDKIIFLGDAADRGPEGWKIIKAILDNPKWTYLMGNHEDMLIEYIRKGYSSCHNMNGGKPTQNAVDIEDKEKIKYYYQLLKNLPFNMEVTNKNGDKIWLSHSGSISNDKDDCIWSRNHFLQPIKECGYDYVIHGHTPIPYMIENINGVLRWCGEESLPKDWEKGKAYKYLDYNFNLDNLTIITEKATLLNIDTFESISFEADSLDYC